MGWLNRRLSFVLFFLNGHARKPQNRGISKNPRYFLGSILRADQDEICVVKMDWCFFFSERKIKIGRPQRLAKKVLYHARFAYYFCTASITKDSPTLFLPRLPTRLISGFQFLRVMSVRHTSKPESNLTPFIMR